MPEGCGDGTAVDGTGVGAPDGSGVGQETRRASPCSARGSIRAKNAQNILLKNLLDACVGAIWFWMTGYGFAYGARTDSQWGNWFIGNDLFFLNGQGFVTKDAFHNWFFQFAFAATAATIVSGAVAERCSMVAYAGYSAFLTGFVYPVVAHWIWSGDGWLSAFIHDPIFNVGVVDFAGCGVVHMVGGAAAGVGAYILGPRLGRFGGENAGPIKGHSMPLTAVTTTLAAAAGGVTNLFIHYKLTHTYDVAEMCNGILAGLVSITSACAVVEPWAALVIGFVGAWVYTAGSKILVAYYIDDAVNATPVHFFAGAWGLLAPAFFARPENMRAAYGNHSRAGLFYTGDFSMLGCQLLALVSVTAWVVALMGPFFLAMNRFGLFRVPEDMEIDGLDSSKHGGSAYGFDLEAKVVPAATTAPAPAEV
ncbi:ammonium transmembrane transporter [Aureococcus anophagefferens]|nr:ammonium transmembrane transporter [Aureococcus anophagefferens]